MDQRTNAGWMQSPRWYELKNGEYTQKVTQTTASFFIGAGVVIIPRGHVDPVEVKHYVNKKGKAGVLVKAWIAMYHNHYEMLISFGDTRVSRIMASLEMGDHIFIVGKKKKYSYINRKKQRKEKSEVYVFFISTDAHIEAVQSMYTNPHVQLLLDGKLPSIEDRISGDEDEIKPYDESEWENEPEFDAEADVFEGKNNLDEWW